MNTKTIRNFTKLLCLLLCFVMLTELIPSNIFASTKSLLADNDVATQEIASSILYEVEELREEYSKVYLLDNGNYMAVSAPDALHYYEEEEDKWLSIDNSLVEATKDGKKVYQSKANSFTASLPQTLNSNTPVTVEKDGHSLSFLLLDTTKQASMKQEQTSMSKTAAKLDAIAKTAVSSESEKIAQTKATLEALSIPDSATVTEQAAALVQADKRDTSVTYASVMKNTDVKYDISGSSVKESIMIHSRPSQVVSYTYEIQTEGLSAHLQQDNSIQFVDDSSKKTIFTMPAPYMFDSNTEETKHSLDVEVSFSDQGDGVYCITYTPSLTWLQESDTQYPVTLDPTVTISAYNIIDTYTIQNWITGSYESSSAFTCGETGTGNYAYIKATSLPTLPRGAVVTDATLNLYKSAGSSDDYVSAKQVTVSWNVPLYSMSVLAHNDTPNDTLKVGVGQWASFNVTKSIADWYNNGNNYGIVLRSTSGKSSTFHSTENTSDNKPYFTIEYAYAGDVDEKYTYHTQGLGKAGTAYVNDFTGNLFVQRQDLTVDGNRMPVDITMNFEAAVGWKLTYLQAAHSIPYMPGVNNTAVFRTNMGKMITLKFEGSTAKDDEELGYELTAKRYVGGGYMHDYDIKTPEGLLYRYIDLKLTAIIDTNNPAQDQISFEYDSSGRVSTITDGAGRVYRFTYTNANTYPQKIDYLGTGTTALQTVSYLYNTSGKITKVTYPDASTVSYTYDTNGNLTSATDIDGYKISYSYTTGSAKRVSRIEERATDNTLGEWLNITYGVYNTTYTDYAGNTNSLLFDRFGNTLTDTVNSVENTHYKYDYEKRNSLIGASETKLYNANLLVNSGFEQAVGSEYSGALLSGTTTPNAYLSSATARTGRNSYYIQARSNMVYSFSQKATLISLYLDKAFTFTAYAKNLSSQSVSAKLKISQYSSANVLLHTYESDYVSLGEDWSKLTVHCEHTTTGRDSYLKAEVILDAQSGAGVFLDDLQISHGINNYEYNQFDNSAWTSGIGHWSSSSRTAFYPGINHMSMVSNITGKQYTQRRIYINGKAGDTYSFGGAMIVGPAVLPVNDNTPDRKLFIEIQALKEGSASEYETLATEHFGSFAEGTNNIRGQFKLEHDTTYIDFYIRTEYQRSTSLYFSEFELVKESSYYSVTEDQQPTTETTTVENVPQGIGESTQYDQYGNEISSSTTNGRVDITQKYTYTTNGNYLVSESDPLGNTTYYNFNQQKGQLNSTTDAKGNTTNYTYNSSGALSSVSANASGLNTEGSITTTVSNTYTYTNDKLATITHNGFTYTFTYDKWGSLTDIKAGSTSLLTYNYSSDAKRLLNSLRYGNGQYVYLNYDAKDRLSGIKYTGDSSDRFEYSYYDDGSLRYFKDYANGILLKNEGSKVLEYNLAGTELKHSYYTDYTADSTLLIETISARTLQTLWKYDNNGNHILTEFDISATKKAQKEIRYDDLGRVIQEGANVSTNGATGHTVYWQNYLYKELSGNRSTERVHAIDYTFGSNETEFNHNLSYTYDERGDVLSIKKNGILLESYTYDELGQLKTVTFHPENKMVTYLYDQGGNILKKTTTNTQTQASSSISYGYTDTNWKDKLTSYNGKAITYDAAGNVKTYDGATYTWEAGRQLKSYTKSGTTISYQYNAEGIRTSKTINGVTTYYTLVDDRVTHEKTGVNEIFYRFDEDSKLVSLNYGGLEYFYVYNLQGDVIYLLDETGNIVVSYTYDVWGLLADISGTLANTLGIANPYRYRGYRYDTETGLYYLQSRYYSSEWGRFINADSPTILFLANELLNANLYVYCNNQPVSLLDYNGEKPAGTPAKIYYSKKKESTLQSLIRRLATNKAFLYATQKGWFKELFWAAGFFRDSSGVYHARQDCVQQYGGYNEFYDSVFHFATDMRKAKYALTYNGKDYIFWAWKGDYLNLGAGAELGIYERLVVNGKKTDQWLVNQKLAMPMSMNLKYNRKTIIDYGRGSNLWWATGFNPYYQNVNASKLVATFTIDFRSNKEMFKAFYKKFGTGEYKDYRWSFDTKNYIATLKF